jgi:hypothetical protein
MNTRKAIGQKKKRGFSLIEIAIYLGVVALVIGGIWSASASFYENYKVSKTLEGNLEISRNLQRLISNADARAMPSWDDLTPFALDSNSFPTDWVNGTKVTHPFGGNVEIRNVEDAGFKKFNIFLFGIGKSACIKLVRQASNIASMTSNLGSSYNNLGLRTLKVMNTNTYFSNFPVSLDAAKAACNDASSIELRFGFNYTRIN